MDVSFLNPWLLFDKGFHFQDILSMLAVNLSCGFWKQLVESKLVENFWGDYDIVFRKLE